MYLSIFISTNIYIYKCIYIYIYMYQGSRERRWMRYSIPSPFQLVRCCMLQYASACCSRITSILSHSMANCMRVLRCVASRCNMLHSHYMCATPSRRYIHWCVAVCCSILQYFTVTLEACYSIPSPSSLVCCSMLQYVAVCCSTLQSHYKRAHPSCRHFYWCVAVCCSMLQYVAVCCNMLQSQCCMCYIHITSALIDPVAISIGMLQYAAVCYSMLQYVAVFCSMLQYVAVTL